MRCPLCGHEMTWLKGAQRGRVSELVYYCEKHGILNKAATPAPLPDPRALSSKSQN
jgi:hypothetical protein